MRYKGATKLGRRRMRGDGTLVAPPRDNQCLGCHGSSRNDPPYGTLGCLAMHGDGEGGIEGVLDEPASNRLAALHDAARYV